jgi:hypothetical protein
MKKVKIAFIGLMLLGFTAGVFAQDKKDAAVKSTKPTKPAKSTAAKSTAKTDKTTATKADNSAPAKASSGQHLKKDGTPDMRYKENKQAAAKPASKTTSTKKAASTKATPAATDKK